MKFPNNIPPNALKVSYHYDKEKGIFNIWPSSNKVLTPDKFWGRALSTLQPRWQWYALGKTGEGDTKELAIQAAYASITKQGKINKGELD